MPHRQPSVSPTPDPRSTTTTATYSSSRPPPPPTPASFSLRLARARFFDACCDHGASMARRVVLPRDAAAREAGECRPSRESEGEAARAVVRVADAHGAERRGHGRDGGETGAVMDAVVAVTDESDVRAEYAAAMFEKSRARRRISLRGRYRADRGLGAVPGVHRGDKRSMFGRNAGYIADFKPSLAMAAGRRPGSMFAEVSITRRGSRHGGMRGNGCVARHGREEGAVKAGALKSLTDAYAAAMNAGGGATNEAPADRCKARPSRYQKTARRAPRGMVVE